MERLQRHILTMLRTYGKRYKETSVAAYGDTKLRRGSCSEGIWTGYFVVAVIANKSAVELTVLWCIYGL